MIIKWGKVVDYTILLFFIWLALSLAGAWDNPPLPDNCPPGTHMETYVQGAGVEHDECIWNQ